MKTSIKTLLMISVLTYSFDVFAHSGDESNSVNQGNTSMSQESTGMTVMKEKM
ncbi:MAG: hypothetical protein K2W94_02355 [Alphaproteobacteria bacterium]|jgi:hypothetical protein|nr:hypothetical protein [Alphaproteobacteria bacterium]